MTMGRTKTLCIIIPLLVGIICCYLWVVCSVENDSSEDVDPLIKTHDDAKVKKIVFWSSLFGQKKWGTQAGERRSDLTCQGNAVCRMYSDQKQPLLYDALVFHARDPPSAPEERSPNQVYIIFVHESPAYREDYFIQGGNFYNWTMTYSRKSDFFSPYFFFMPRKSKSVGSKFSKSNFYNLTSLSIAMRRYRYKGEAIVFWVVSHCNTYSHREDYVDALKNHMPIDIYGKCGKDCRPLQKASGKDCREFLANTGQYKFYLSFENSACRDYITDKVVNALKYGLVPVVFGGLSTEDYTALLPPRSFIDVRNFTSPKHLADYLYYLDRNDQAYMEYHAWRVGWEWGSQDENVWCKVCRDLHNVGKVPPRRIDWGKSWNPATECDNHLLEKVLGKGI